MKPDLGGSGLCSTRAPCIDLNADLRMPGAEALCLHPGSAVFGDVACEEEVLVCAVLVCIGCLVLFTELAPAVLDDSCVDGGC
mmetsp:Transcript_34665/g.56101  ORF Transcript_34665/g.56101 Transcript_34665/m.56101 type:complete len:83 (-) Transcript_34665:115-363(-)